MGMYVCSECIDENNLKYNIQCAVARCEICGERKHLAWTASITRDLEDVKEQLTRHNNIKNHLSCDTCNLDSSKCFGYRMPKTNGDDDYDKQCCYINKLCMTCDMKGCGHYRKISK